MTSETDIDAASKPYGMTMQETDTLSHTLWIDTRRRTIFEQAATMLPNARWRDPGEVHTWQPEMPRDRPVLVYCVHGHAVSRGVALRLRAAGIDAWFLRGGIEGWQAAGRPLQALGEAAP